LLRPSRRNLSRERARQYLSLRRRRRRRKRGVGRGADVYRPGSSVARGLVCFGWEGCFEISAHTEKGSGELL
jgi:hypothetical protein